MLITVLRDLRVDSDDGSAVPVAGARLQALLVRLAVDVGRPVSTGELIDTIWADPPADPAGALQALVSRLRRTLGVTIEQTGTGYRLLIEPADVDLHRFHALVERGREGDPSAYAEALRLLDGPPLPVVADQPWALPLVARIEQQALEAEHKVIESRLAAGELTGLSGWLRDLVAAHPLDEDFAAQLIRTLRAQGQSAEALAAYEQTRRTLADTLGTDPGSALQELYADLLRGAEPVVRGSHLRAGLTSFLGRDRELAQVTLDLAHDRLVTLAGPGGAGKTRLAAEAGNVWRQRHLAPVWFIELAAVTEPAAVLPTFVAALDLQTSRVFDRLRDSGRPVDDWGLLTGALSTDEQLLIVDNAEHLLDPVARLIEDLLVAVPTVRVLVTSREPLAIDGEHVRSLPPLATDPATQLFLDRAASAGVTVSDEDSASVAEIVRRLDGLPLAIELAAARVRTLPVPVIAGRLSDRFALLTGGRRTALPRHRTLYAVVAWSWDLLEPPEQQLLQRFSAFAGGATPDAVATVTGADESLLASLVDKSLLVMDRSASGLRYRLLETIREFGLTQLAAAGEATAVRQEHARWAIAFARDQDSRLRGPEQADALARLDADTDNLVAALRFLTDSGDARGATDLLLALSWALMMTDDDHRTLALAQIALEADGAVDPARRGLVRMMQVAAQAAIGVLDLAQSRPRMRQATTAVEADPTLFADYPHALILVALAAAWTDLPEVTARLMQQALEHDDPWVRAAALLTRIDLAENAGEHHQLRADVAALEAAVGPLQDRWLTAAMLVRRSQVESFDGDPGQAMATLHEARELIDALGRSGDAMFLAVRAMDLRLRLGDYDGARAAIADVPQQWHEVIGEDVPHAFLVTIAVAEGDSERLAEAREALGQPQPVAGAFHDHSEAIVHSALALLEAADGDPAASVTALRTAYPAALKTADMPILAGYTVSAAFAVSLDRPERAAECLGEAATIRGADDPGEPIVAVLTRRLRAALGDGFDAAYARGRSKDRADAITDVDPAVLFASG